VLAGSTLYDVREGEVSVEIPQAFAATDPAQLSLTLTTMTGSSATIRAGAGVFTALDASPDGLAYVSLGMATDLTGLDRTLVDLVFEAAPLSKGQAEAHVDNVNHGP